jgi:hypothetical protein
MTKDSADRAAARLSLRSPGLLSAVATLAACAILMASCDGGDDELAKSQTILWNSTSEHGQASVFVVRDFSDLEAVRERVPDRAELFDWPSVDFLHSVFIVYVDGASEAKLSREGIYIYDREIKRGELVLTVEPGDDRIEDDSDAQWWDFQVISVSPSDLPPGRGVRVVTPDGQTLASGR